MIVGLTHDPETNIIKDFMRFGGKISAGYQPNEGPNKTNAPMASGFFRVMKEVIVTRMEGGQKKQYQEWVLNEDIQKKLVDENNGSENPRRIEFICAFEHPEDLWDSHMGKYSSKDGLVCRSQGINTPPMQLVTRKQAGKEIRSREPRLFDGQAKCPYDKCPDFINGSCKQHGIMRIIPLCDISFNLYKFETRSINTILAIESSVRRIYDMAEAAHYARFGQTTDKKFQGLRNVKMTLVHRKIKSGGRDVFVTHLEPSKEFVKYVMTILMTKASNTYSLEAPDDRLALEAPDSPQDGDTPLLTEGVPIPAETPDDEKATAREFPASDAAKVDDKTLDKAAESLKK